MKSEKKATSWDDIIFENRNKKYGAYELRVTYKTRLIKSFLITILSGFTLFFIIRLFNANQNLQVDKEIYQDSLVFVNIIPIHLDNIDRGRTKQIKKIDKSVDNRNTIPLIVDSVIDQPIDTSSTLAMGEMNKVDSSSAGGSVGELPAGNGTGAGLATDTFSTAGVDKVPEFPGGMDKFYAYLVNKIKYTRDAQGT
jgi:protein TonB